MWNPFSCIDKEPPRTMHAHYENAKEVRQIVQGMVPNPHQLIYVCIGTDRSTGDTFGPLVGTRLEREGFTVYGTLDNPIHAVNLQDELPKIKERAIREGRLIMAIDACLGRTESVGQIKIARGSLKPGTGVNKDLPSVGDLSAIGIVNVGGFMEYLVLQNTRLSLVMRMADIFCQALIQHASAYINAKEVSR